MLAPSFYGMDYLFATVMLSNPLFWMEIQFLSDERRKELAPILNVWKEHRDALANADVEPIGERPSGVSFTGFKVSVDGNVKYLLLFREVSDTDSMTVTAVGAPKLLCSNTDAKVESDGRNVKITLPKQRAYAFVEITD